MSLDLNALQTITNTIAEAIGIGSEATFVLFTTLITTFTVIIATISFMFKIYKRDINKILYRRDKDWGDGGLGYN